MKKIIPPFLLLFFSTAQATTSNFMTGSDAYSAKLLEVFIVLSLILIFIFICAFLLRKTKLVGKQCQGQIKILTTFPLSQKEKLMIIQVGGKQLLLGVTAHSIQALKSFDEPIDFASNIADEHRFGDQLKKFLSKGNP